MKTGLKIFLCFVSLFGVAQNSELFDKGNALYNEGKYLEAITNYKAILETKEHSAEVYFNLANAHYKLNHIAPSIFYYEKALLLKPNDKDILKNLSFAQNMTIDAIDKVPNVGFSKIFNNIITITSTDNWARLSVSGVFVFVILFLLYHFAYATAQKRIAFVVSLLSLLIAGVALILAYQKSRLETKNNPAIVFTQEAKVKTDPNNSSEEIFRLHEGTKVQVLESYNDWYKIEIADKSVGWIEAEAIKTLKPKS